MTATYVAWNGQSYPWPPPEGWYLASDGQWWASGTGPNPPATPSSDLPSRARQNPRPSAPPTTAAQPQSLAQPAPQHAQGNTPQPQYGAPHTGVPAPVGAPGAIWQEPSKRPSGNMSTWLIAGLAVLALIIFAGLVVLVTGLGGDNDQSEVTGPDLTERTTTTESSQTTLELETTTTTEATTTTTEAETTTTVGVPPAELVAAFRARLDQDGLNADQLTDTDIIEFGATFCILAQIADDPPAFDIFRAELIADNDGDLTEDELNQVVDHVIIVFCPDEAARLGVS